MQVKKTKLESFCLSLKLVWGKWKSADPNTSYFLSYNLTQYEVRTIVSFCCGFQSREGTLIVTQFVHFLYRLVL
jgi:hypothetical protein